MVVGERQGLVDHRSQTLSAGTLLALCFLFEDALSVLGDRHGAYIRARFYM